MTTLCFNSVPMELVADSTGDSKLTPKASFCTNLNKLEFVFATFCNIQERVTILIEQLRQFGVAEKLLFCPEDLLEKKNIPKVARCLANCVDLVGATCNMCSLLGATGKTKQKCSRVRLILSPQKKRNEERKGLYRIIWNILYSHQFAFFCRLDALEMQYNQFIQVCVRWKSCSIVDA